MPWDRGEGCSRCCPRPQAVWISEFGDDDGSGLRMLEHLHQDVHQLRIRAWCYWQPLDYGGWGLLQADVGYGALHFARLHVPHAPRPQGSHQEVGRGRVGGGGKNGGTPTQPPQRPSNRFVLIHICMPVSEWTAIQPKAPQILISGTKMNEP